MSTPANSPSQQAEQDQPWYSKGSVPLGSCIQGIPIYVHWSFFALLGMMMLSTLLSGNAGDGAYWGFIILLYGPILLITIILHEFGHALMTKKLGGQVGDMVLWPLGGFVICGPVESVVGDFQVAIAGPIMHIPQMIFWLIIFVAIEQGDWEHFSMYVDTSVNFGALLASQAFYLNLVLFVFNLFVPAYPLDGGRCLAAGLILCGMTVLQAAMATAVVGMAIAAALAIWGIVTFFKGSPSGFFTFLIGAWIFMGSLKLFRATRPPGGDSAVAQQAASDNLKTHPVFGQRAYQERARGERAQASSNV